jgi:hypothetical protein
MISNPSGYQSCWIAVAFVLGLSFTTSSQAAETQCADVASLDSVL